MNTEPNLTLLETTPANDITQDDVVRSSKSGVRMYKDSAAVAIVIQDAEQADNFININQWSAGWMLADLLYQSPMPSTAFDGNTVSTASVPKFTVSNHVSSIVPKLTGGLFYEDPCFMLRPEPGVDQFTIDCKTAILSYQLVDQHFEEEAERTTEQMALFGTGIMKWGWSQYPFVQKTYRPIAPPATMQIAGQTEHVDTQQSDEFEVVYETKQVTTPWCKYCDLRTVLVDPGLKVGDIRRAKWVIYRDYATFEDLDHLRATPGYTIPSQDVLEFLFFNNKGSQPDNITMTLLETMQGYLQHALPRSYKTSSDPLQGGMMMLERWTKDKVMVVLSYNGHNILIRNDENPYGEIPFYSANWRNIPDAFYGQGLGLLIGSEQLVDQGVTNLALGLLSYGLQPTAVRKRGFNAPTQQLVWRQGGIIDVEDDVDKAFKFLEMPPVPQDAWRFLADMRNSAASTSGANAQVVQGAGGEGIQTTGMRSGTGAAAVVQATESRLDGPEGRFIRQVFKPWLHKMDDLDNDFLPASEMRQILGNKLGGEYAAKLDHIKYRNAKATFEVLAGAHLGQKRSMAQFLPIVIQLMNNPSFTNMLQSQFKVFDADAIFNAFSAIAGWKFQQPFVRDMSAEEKKHAIDNSPAAIQAKQQAAVQQQNLRKYQQEQELESQQAFGRGANLVLREAAEKALQPEEVTGQAENTPGIGGSTGL